jgi:hypothetical protein
MSKLLAVAVRELRERWLLFPGALASGCFPLVLPAFGVEREVMPVVGFVGAVLLGLGAAVVIGSSMLARDAANGRLGFLFSRPVPWSAIWGGKWLAAVVLVAGTVASALVPWMAVYAPDTVGGHHGGSWLRVLADSPVAFLAVLLLLGIGFANFNATLLRSRSPWAALDLVLLLGAIWAARQYVAPLWRYGLVGLDEAGWTIALSLAPLVLGLLVGSLAQVAVGRTDLRRAHRALSLGFWAVVAAFLAAAAGYWAWVRSAGPADVSVHAVTGDPAGRWAYVEGSGRHSGWYPHGFLVDTATGRYVVGPEPDEDRRFGFGVLFSADGRLGALPHSDGRGAALTLYDLAGDAPHLTEVSLESSPPPSWSTGFALSPSAASVFVVHESGASLYALPSGRRVATATIGPGWRPSALRFLAEDEARAWLVPSTGAAHARARAEMRVVELASDGTSSGVTFPTSKRLEPGMAWRGVVPDAEGRRIVTADAGLHLRDGATGAPVGTLADETRGLAAFFLGDGRIAVGDTGSRAEPGPPRALLRTFDPAGAPLGELRLDLLPGGLRVGPEVAPGRVAVSSFQDPLLGWDTLLVDVGEGRVVERLSALWPAASHHWDVSSSAPAGTGATSVHFFQDEKGRLLRIDFATGERKVVAGPGAPRGERISVR